MISDTEHIFIIVFLFSFIFLNKDEHFYSYRYQTQNQMKSIENFTFLILDFLMLWIPEHKSFYKEPGMFILSVKILADTTGGLELNNNNNMDIINTNVFLTF